MAAIEHGSALGVGQATVVTLTVAEGVDLDAVGRAFAERYAGLFTGAWLVPETSPKWLRHYHGLVIGNRAEIIGAWQRCYGGIERAQWLDPLDQGDHEHLFRAVAYAMKRRHMEPGDVIATGVLASPWALADASWSNGRSRTSEHVRSERTCSGSVTRPHSGPVQAAKTSAPTVTGPTRVDRAPRGIAASVDTS